MAKSYQLPVRMEPEIRETLERVTDRTNRSKGIVVCAALHAMGKMSARQQDAAIKAYLDSQKAAKPGARAKSSRRRSG